MHKIKQTPKYTKKRKKTIISLIWSTHVLYENWYGWCKINFSIQYGFVQFLFIPHQIGVSKICCRIFSITNSSRTDSDTRLNYKNLYKTITVYYQIYDPTVFF